MTHNEPTICIGESLLLSKKFQTLSVGSQMLYFCMAMESGDSEKFLFPQKVGKKYGFVPSSMRRHITELENGGFITKKSMASQPNIYYFSMKWKEIGGDDK